MSPPSYVVTTIILLTVHPESIYSTSLILHFIKLQPFTNMDKIQCSKFYPEKNVEKKSLLEPLCQQLQPQVSELDATSLAHLLLGSFSNYSLQNLSGYIYIYIWI